MKDITIPPVTSKEAIFALEMMNAKYNYPANPANCARYGWEAARLYLDTAIEELAKIPKPVLTPPKPPPMRQFSNTFFSGFKETEQSIQDRRDYHMYMKGFEDAQQIYKDMV